MVPTELGAAVKVSKGGAEAANWLVRGLLQRRALGQSAQKARELLGIGNSDLTYRIGALHPDLIHGTVHPDDEAALISVAGPAVEAARRAGTFKVVASIALSLNDSLLLIGSPESEAITRLMLGYSSRSDGAGMSRWTQPPVDVPYSFLEDSTVVTATSSRFAPGRGLQTRPNWPIVANLNRSEQLLFPTVDKLGLMSSDYLLITRMRNFLTTNAYQSGRTLTSIAGSHGIGTRAIQLLMRDKKSLALIHRLIGRSDAFQILVYVGDIHHDSSYGSRGRSIEVSDVQTLSLTHTQWEAATARVTNHMTTWRAEVNAYRTDKRSGPPMETERSHAER